MDSHARKRRKGRKIYDIKVQDLKTELIEEVDKNNNTRIDQLSEEINEYKKKIENIVEFEVSGIALHSKCMWYEHDE